MTGSLPVPPADLAPSTRAALPTMVVVGAMKCGTSALHDYLAAHPEVSMSATKELNFFFGPDHAPPGPPDTWWRHGQWHRGLEWYADQFDARRRVRGESSPGYTDPSHPHVADRIAAVIPEARLVYLVRNPVDRAVSQHAHHVRDRTERRPVEQAVLDPHSQYLARSRYHERIAPFLDRFPRDQLLVVVQERLLADPGAELRRVFAHVGADPGLRTSDTPRTAPAGGSRQHATPQLRRAVWDRVSDDVDRLRGLLDDELLEWVEPDR